VKRHNIFISYHHDNDQGYRDQFENMFITSYDIAVSKSVQIGDINPNLPTDRIRQIIRDQYIKDTTVTIVLIGKETWKRKHIDWEIGSSIRQTQNNSRCGLIGILLPSRDDYYRDKYDPHTVPPRLVKNVDCGFAKIYNWSTNYTHLSSWIQEAFDRRDKITPDNSFQNFVNNRTGDRWYE